MITVDWLTKVVSVPQSFLTLVSGTLYTLDLDAFRLALKAIEASEDGMSYVDIHKHTAAVILSGVAGPITVEIINGYTLTFEDASYRVNIVGGNSNITDVANLNLVQLVSNNSFGLVDAGITPEAIAGEVRTELTPELTLINDNLDAPISSVITAIGALNDLGAADVATAILGAVVEGTITIQQALRLTNSAHAAITLGMDTSSGTLRDIADTKDRVVAQLDQNGNRTGIITLDLT